MSDPRPPLLDLVRFGGKPLAKRRGKVPDRSGGVGAHRDVGRETMDRVSGERGIDADVNDLGLWVWALGRRNPRNIAFDHDNRIGRRDMFPRLEAQMHGMVRGQTHVARPVRNHGDREGLGKLGQGRD